MSRWILKLSSRQMQAWRRLRHWSMPSSVTLCYTPTHASNTCRLKSFTSCTFCVRLAAPDFVKKCIEAKAVQWPEVWKFYGSLTLLHFPTGGTNDAQCQRRHSSRKRKRQAEFILKWYDTACLPWWLSGLRHSVHRPERSAGGVGFNPRIGQ